MAVSSCPRVSAAFECRSEPDFCGGPHRPEAFASGGRFSGKASSVPSHRIFGASALSSLIFRFPPNFVRQLSTKARRNCSNIGVAQVVAASWSADSAAAAAASASAAAAASVEASVEVSVVESSGSDVQYEDLADEKASFLGFDGTLTIHAGIYISLCFHPSILILRFCVSFVLRICLFLFMFNLCVLVLFGR